MTIRYSYIVLPLYGPPERVEPVLNELGGRGWRIVNVAGGFVYTFEKERSSARGLSDVERAHKGIDPMVEALAKEFS